jgi:hypothetical protein
MNLTLPVEASLLVEQAQKKGRCSLPVYLRWDLRHVVVFRGSHYKAVYQCAMYGNTMGGL